MPSANNSFIKFTVPITNSKNYLNLRIAINTRFLSSPNLEGLGRFSYETSKWMVNHHPEHEYFFIFDRPYNPDYIFSDRITPVIIPPRARHPLLWYIWYEWSLPRILKKHKIDLFISTDGLGTLSSHVPSCTVIHDLAFEHFPDQVSFFTRKYYQHFIPRYVKHSSMLATVSEATKNDMVLKYKVTPDKIGVVESACPQHFQPQTALIKQGIKRKYSNGRDFFVFVGAIHPRKNVLRIIEAFATFKQKYQTGMKLLLIGRKAWMTAEFEQALTNHPYRDDIIHLQDIDKEELSKIVGSAFASVYPSLLEGFGLPILEAQKSGVPVITSDCSAMPEVAGNAALLVNPFSAGDIAVKMGMLFDNEILRLELIERGLQNWPRYSWDKTAELLYRCAIKAVSKT